MNHNKSILMTLGHNSSVIFYDCENNPIGYEEERLSGIKSDSAYPIKAFEKVLENTTNEQIQGANIFVSHWFDTLDISEFPAKYFNRVQFEGVCKLYNLKPHFLDSSFTHHDAHAYSGLAFKENYLQNSNSLHHHLVVDGFGNNQEVLSLYEEHEGDLHLIKRIYGYENSLGLLYQYATSFCGMKENQDEYKFLGYESKIKSVLTDFKINLINLEAEDFANSYFNDCIINDTHISAYNFGYIDLGKLVQTKERIHKKLAKLLNDFVLTKPTSDTSRTIIGYFVQCCLEKTILAILRYYDIENVTLTGGCFMNVKLNNVILNQVIGTVCVNPLCGDQGAAIGMFTYYTGEKFDFSDLCWGIRDKQYLSDADAMAEDMNFVIANTDNGFVEIVSKLLKSGNIVNVIQGNMEFGPRALCNTTTLANPTEDNVRYINMVNNRNEVMPMAPVILEYNAEILMCENKINRVVGSNKFMIMAHNVKGFFVDGNRGVMHVKPDGLNYTCRPQVINNNSNSNIARILENSGYMCLINTSFNTHGRPILFSVQNAIDDFRKQREKDLENIIYLVILQKND